MCVGGGVGVCVNNVLSVCQESQVDQALRSCVCVISVKRVEQALRFGVCDQCQVCITGPALLCV